VFINGKQNELPSRAKLQFFYTVTFNTNVSQAFIDQYNITEYSRVFSLKKSVLENDRIKNYLRTNNINLKIINDDGETVSFTGNVSQDMFDKLKVGFSNNALNVNLTDELAAELRKNQNIKSVVKDLALGKGDDTFPKSPDYSWNRDNFGPLYIPEAGKTIDLTLDNLPLYKRAISVYEGNTISINGNQILINGDVANTYTFKMDYYWMMGDNRHNSQDARSWGFVPQNHVVGKPVMVWMSWDSNASGINKIRWERLFTTVKGEGKPTSYLWVVILLIAGYVGYSRFKKKKKNA
jgi:signal peptidase I